MPRWHDITEQFEFLEERLVYVDAPLEGLVRRKGGGNFAFRCQAVIPGRLWHWVLVPVDSLETSVEVAFQRAVEDPPPEWCSVVEDRRELEPRLDAVWLTGKECPVPGQGSRSS
jgi:hypothetical protein